MRALAQFVMRGPVQASGVAAVTIAVPFLFWIGAAVVGLVILRLGFVRGLNIGLWALLPALAWSFIGGDPTSLAVLLHVMLMAQVLRSTLSWERALIAGSSLALLAGLLLPLLFSGLLDQLVATGVSFYEQYNAEVARELGSQLETAIRNIMNASLAGTFLACATGITMLARYWQASLYNPGGFREEFHRFRLRPLTAGLCGAAIVLAPMAGINPVLIAWVAGLPLFVAAVALVHGLVGLKGKGGFWLAIFYSSLILLGPTVLLLLLVMAFVDSWLDIRGRIRPSGPAE